MTLCTNDLKRLAAGNWPEILRKTTGINISILDGKHHPCPKCGGSDRFRMINKDQGVLLCNQCFNKQNGDGIAAVMWLLDTDFKTAIDRIAVSIDMETKPIQNVKKRSRKLDYENPVEMYDYRDTEGNLIYQAVRLKVIGNSADNKNFLLRKPKDGGGWEYNLGDTKRVLYRLSEVINAESDLLLIAEGEKDVNNLFNHGYVATCNVGGAGIWRTEYSKALGNRDIVIFEDNDEAGAKHADQVATSLVGLAKSIRIVRFKDMPAKSDVSDWLALGKSEDDLKTLIDSAEPWQKPKPTEVVRPTLTSRGFDSDPSTEDLDNDAGRSDNANATRFVDKFENVIRFVPNWNKWLVWDRRRWKIDVGDIAVTKLARRYAQGLWNLIGLIAQKGAAREELGKAQTFVRKSNDANSISAMLRLAKSDDRVVVEVDSLNTNPYLLNVKNGTVDLKNGELKPHCQDDLITQLADVEFDKHAQCPQWKETLKLIFDSDFELVEYVQKLIGYSASADTGEHILPICYGAGENGKSTIWNPIQTILGEYSALAPESLLLGFKHEHPTVKAMLYQKRFVAVSEPPQDTHLKESLVKELTGDDTITARGMKEDFWSFKRSHTFWMSTNHLPQIKGTDNGIWRRIKLIPFNVRIRDKVKEVRKDFVKKLVRDEASGILNWIVIGFRKYLAEGLEEPKAVIQATECYRNEQDVIERFIAECCEVDRESECLAKDLFKAFKEWDENSKMSQAKFGKAMVEKFVRVRSKSGRYRDKTIYKGLQMRLENENSDVD